MAAPSPFYPTVMLVQLPVSALKAHGGCQSGSILGALDLIFTKACSYAGGPSLLSPPLLATVD